MRKLDNIHIKNFKSIRTLNLNLNALNVLIGANGSGKSNFIGIFKFLNEVINKRLQVYTGQSGGSDSILHYGRKKSEELALSLSFAKGTNGYNFMLAPTADDRFIFSEELIWYHKKESYPGPLAENLGEGHSESKLPDYAKKSGRNIANYVIDDLKSWKLYHFHDTSDNAKIKQTADISDNRVLHPDARNLASFLYRIKETHPQHYNNIEDAIRLVAPFFEGFQLEPSPFNKNSIMLEWKETGSDKIFNAYSLSDGTLRFMCLATLLLQPNLPSMVILDEPELGLHPYAIAVLADMLRAAAERSQVVIATQSVTLVNQFEPSQVLVVEREEGQSTFKHLQEANMQQWLDEFGLGDLWEKNILGGRP